MNFVLLLALGNSSNLYIRKDYDILHVDRLEHGEVPIRNLTEVHQPRIYAVEILVVTRGIRTVNQVLIHHNDSASDRCIPDRIADAGDTEM